MSMIPPGVSDPFLQRMLAARAQAAPRPVQAAPVAAAPVAAPAPEAAPTAEPYPRSGRLLDIRV